MDHGGAAAVASTSAGRLASVPKHKVFLSHSGAQKGFVEQLFLDLQRSDRCSFFDQCRDSLPIGKNFPEHIFEAIKQCEVGVVVLSEEYFTRSKWPMLELNALVKAQKENGSMTIVPVYLGVSRERCRDEAHIQQWVSKWQGWAEDDKRVDVEEWKQAVRVFRPINDLCCEVGGPLGEVQCREEIVQAICKLVPPDSVMDDSYVQGRSRLCKVISGKIMVAQESAWYGARVVGVYGVGGIGKTTACKSLCNEYRREFNGKVCHAELGNEGDERGLLQDMLKRLTDTRDEVARDFNVDECRDRLKREIQKQRVFLALDNVSDSFTIMEQARCYLRLGYHEGSIIVVTARSLDVLLLLKVQECDCLEMPELEEAEARCLFMHHANLPPDEANKQSVFRHVKRCRFRKGNGSSYHYHPLAVKVLGLQVGIGFESWTEAVEGDVFNKLRNGDTHPVFSILRQSFDTLLPEDQLLFMDAALFSTATGVDSWDRHGDYIFEWLSMVHEIGIDDLKKRLLGLKRKSLIEEVGDGRSRISIHDLWREFAVMETSRGEEKQRRWVYMDQNETEEMRGRDACGVWVGSENLQRVCLRGKIFFPSWRMKEVNLGRYSNLTVLKLLNLELANVTLDLSGLRHLKSLEFDFEGRGEPLHKSVYRKTGLTWDAGVEIVGLGKVTNLVELVCTNVKAYSFPFEDIECLTNLQILRLDNIRSVQALLMDCMRSKNEFLKLERLCGLRELSLTRIGVGTLSNLSSRMTSLQVVALKNCRKLRTCHGVGDLVALKKLTIAFCGELEELPSFVKLKNLQRFVLSQCRRICSIPSLEGLVSLQDLRVWWCPRLGGILDLRKLTHLQLLQRFELYDCQSISSIPGLGGLVSLQDLRVHGCPRFTGLLDLCKLTNLRRLNLGTSQTCERIKGPVSGVGYLVCLESLVVDQEWLEDYGDLKTLAKLSRVVISRCDLAGLRCLGTLAILEILFISDCREVDDLASIRFLTRLEELTLHDSDFKDVSGLRYLTALRRLRMKSCNQLESLPDMQELVWLEYLRIWSCKKLRVWGSVRIFGTDVHMDWFLAKLDSLYMRDVAWTEFPDLSHFPSLRSLKVTNCGDLTSLRSSGQITTLEEVYLGGSCSLRALPDFSHSKRLGWLELNDCVAKLNADVIKSLEELCPLLELKIEGCSCKHKENVESEEMKPDQEDAKKMEVAKSRSWIHFLRHMLRGGPPRPDPEVGRVRAPSPVARFGCLGGCRK